MVVVGHLDGCCAQSSGIREGHDADGSKILVRIEAAYAVVVSVGVFGGLCWRRRHGKAWRAEPLVIVDQQRRVCRVQRDRAGCVAGRDQAHDRTAAVEVDHRDRIDVVAGDVGAAVGLVTRD